MHSGLSLCALLAGILFILFMQDVEALPVIRNKRASKIVTLPLKRLEASSRNVHPQVLLQQHLNRGNRRLARMTGNEVPTDQALRRNIQKRVLSLEQEQVYKRFNRYTPPVANTKRFNRGGVTPHSNVVVPASLRKGHRKHGNNNNDDQAATAAGNGTTTKGKGGVAAGAAGGAAGGAAAGSASGSGSAGNSNSNSTTTANDSDTVTAAEEPAADNSIGLDIESVDVGYLATIQMGTPPQDFSLLMDSGSADTWVGGENCVSEDGGDCGAHTFLGAQSSSSFVDSGDAFQVTYGTGAVEGTIVQDNIVVAGLNLDAHNFGVATTESVEFSSDQTSFDGLVGLAQSSLSEQGVPTPPEALAAAGLIDGAITSYKISRLADGLNDGEITFGGLDETKFDAKTLVTLNNVNANGFWEADVDSTTVDGVDLGLAGRTAILDTGTTLMIVPAADALAIHQQIDGATTDGQGGFTVPCTTTQSIALTFGGQEFTIDPRDLAFQPLDPTDPEGDCISGIGSGNIGAATQWLVGDTFLKNAYFSHSVDDNTISLAKLI